MYYGFVISFPQLYVMLHFIFSKISLISHGFFFFPTVRVRSISSVRKMIRIVHIQGRGRGKRGNSCRAKRVQNV